jgi:hypothetical protein
MRASSWSSDLENSDAVGQAGERIVAGHVLGLRLAQFQLAGDAADVQEDQQAVDADHGDAHKADAGEAFEREGAVR